MPGQESVERKNGQVEQVTEEHQSSTSSPMDAERKAELDADVDALLDEIDDVLEVNAEQFVKSYVQKGGQ